MRLIEKLTSIGMLPLVVILIFVIGAGWAVMIVASDFYQMGIDAKPAPCDQLPTVEELEKVMAENKEIVEQIKDLAFVDVFRDGSDGNCPGKAEIFIRYGTVFQRNKIKNLIGDTFFGYPYRMFNV